MDCFWLGDTQTMFHLHINLRPKEDEFAMAKGDYAMSLFGIWHDYKLVRPAEKCGRIFRSSL